MPTTGEMLDAALLLSADQLADIEARLAALEEGGVVEPPPDPDPDPDPEPDPIEWDGELQIWRPNMYSLIAAEGWTGGGRYSRRIYTDIARDRYTIAWSRLDMKAGGTQSSMASLDLELLCDHQVIKITKREDDQPTHWYMGPFTMIEFQSKDLEDGWHWLQVRIVGDESTSSIPYPVLVANGDPFVEPETMPTLAGTYELVVKGMPFARAMVPAQYQPLVDRDFPLRETPGFDTPITWWDAHCRYLVPMRKDYLRRSCRIEDTAWYTVAS